MRVIGHAGEVPLRVPDDAYLSFFNSPYVGHQRGSSLDVYPFEREWGCDAFSPVDGIVRFIHETKMGRPKEFVTDEFDYAIGVCPEAHPSLVVRIMHCRPSVAEGEQVEVGSALGSTIRSRFFNYWTGPHYHLDVLHRNDFLRSTRSLPIDANLGRTSFSSSRPSGEVEVEAVSVTDDYIVASFAGLSIGSAGEYTGLVVQSTEGGSRGILDAGVPHYRHGGIIGKEAPTLGAEIALGGQPIGQVIWSREILHYYLRSGAAEFRLEGTRVRGISSFLYPQQYLKRGKPPLVLIPEVLGGFTGVVQEGDACQFSINTVKAR